jgi:hypothetical protein
MDVRSISEAGTDALQCSDRLRTHPDPYPLRNWVSLPEVKSPGREAIHSPPSKVKVKNGGAVSTLRPAFMA